MLSKLVILGECSMAKGLNIFSSQNVEHWSIKCKDLGSNSNYLDTGFSKMQGMTYMTVHGQLVTPAGWMYETQDETLQFTNLTLA